MRVKGNIPPAILSMEPYPAEEGWVEVRLRENLREVTETDTQTTISITMFEYDEYTFRLKGREGLKEEIESNLSDWLITGRALEVNERASAMCDVKQTNAEIKAALAEALTADEITAAMSEGVNSI